MQPPVPGLRRLFQGSNSVAKIELRVQPGDMLDVSADVAAQLEHAGFKPEVNVPAVETTEAEEATVVRPKAARKK